MKLLKFWFFIGFLLLLLPIGVQAGVDDFVISRFDAKFQIYQSGQGYSSMLVTERITAEFPDYNQNHGILRAIPTEYGDFDLRPEISSVTDEAGNSHEFTTYTENNNLVLKIGSPNSYVHGTTTYVITYELANVITFYEDHDELFWNINGTGWRQPIEELSASLIIPPELSTTLQSRQQCFSGKKGSTATNCVISRFTDTNGQTQISIRADNLLAQENVSFVLAWESGTFIPDPWPARIRILLWIVGIAMPLAVTWFMFRQWVRYGKDPEGRGVIIPQYVPLEDFDTLSSDTLLNEQFRTPAISSAIIDLAVKRYLTIYEVIDKKIFKDKTSYELELVKSADKLPSNYKQIIEGIFNTTEPGRATKVNISSQANKLYTVAQKLKTSIPKDLVANGYFRTEPATERTKYLVGGFLVVGIGIFMFTLAISLGVGTLVSGLIISGFGWNMPSRTLKGVEAHDYLLGLKDYIKLAETERIKYLQSPKGIRQYGDPSKNSSKLNLFETLLPFAMLFGLEKDWAKQFERLYKEPPDWFNTARPNFTPLILANSLNSFHSVSTTAFSPPSSSGSSGFSGGGFSGGGGGGGGGGGW